MIERYKTIERFTLHRTGPNLVSMPVGAEILSVYANYRLPAFLAMVDSDALVEERKFWVYGTGFRVEEIEHLRYVGTAQCAQHEGDLVGFLWSIFEDLKP